MKKFYLLTGPPAHDFFNLDLASRNQDWRNQRGDGGGAQCNDHCTKLFPKVFQCLFRKGPRQQKIILVHEVKDCKYSAKAK